jgi:hypothetical protein
MARCWNANSRRSSNRHWMSAEHAGLPAGRVTNRRRSGAADSVCAGSG